MKNQGGAEAEAMWEQAHGAMDARGAGGPSPTGLPPLAHARDRGAAHTGINRGVSNPRLAKKRQHASTSKEHGACIK